MLRQGSGPPGPEDPSSSESHPVPSRKEGLVPDGLPGGGEGGAGMCGRESRQGGSFQDSACDHVTGRLRMPPTPSSPQRLLWTPRLNIPRPAGSKQNRPPLQPSVSRAYGHGGRGWGGGCLTWGGRGGEGRRQGQGGWGPTPPTESRAPIPCQEHARTISRDLGRGRLAAKLNLGELGF